MLRRFVLIFFLGAVCTTSVLFAQNLGNSPYSSVGIGDLVPAQSTQNVGLGGLSVSNYNQDFIQLSNPAMSTNKRGVYKDSLVKIEGAFILQRKQFSTGTNSERVTAANIRYIAFSVPIGKRWNSTVALQPFSVKNHIYTQTQLVTNDPYGRSMQYSFQGTGGLYQVAFNNGVGITKNLSAGLGLAYLFGPTKTTVSSLLITDPTLSVQYEYKYGISKRINHSALAIKPAIHYRKELYKRADTSMVRTPQGVFWNVGFTGEFYSPMNLRVQESLIRIDPSGNSSIDSVVNAYSMHGALPTHFVLGFSIDRPNKWMVGIEGGVANWATGFKYVASKDVYQIGWNVALGGEYRAGNTRRLRAKTYRAGVNYTVLPYVLSDTQLTDVSVSVGATIPVGVRHNGASLPKVNVAFVFGQRGTITNGLGKEVYGRVQLGILITDKWFSKRKIQ